ncbi:alpha/beta fold hydrolase [Arenibacter certesii]|uniref:Alpha/beta hydrolase n=1 Tax=Arenibacter certesii TaxID=228955 RepID=A0A918J3K8_9FLAO|nr:alpha/beta hydrolase [Arenibacter certesii]GGW46210.1 alpha/beta hydrolase [Arenibacter certesii]
MKKLVIVLGALFIQTSVFPQPVPYPFNVEIKGSGDPVILIPGLASLGKVWEQTTDLLDENYEYHILTLAGFANQEPISPEKGYLPFGEKEIIRYIQNELKAKPLLIGHSLGGFLSLSIAISEPALLKEIVIVDSYPFMAAAYNPNTNVEPILPQAHKTREMIVSISDSLFIQQQKLTLPTMITDSENISTAIEWSLQSDRETIAQAMYELMITDLRDDIEKVKIPILVFGSWYGAKNYGITKELVKNNYENQFSKAKDYKIEIAETAKHFIMWDEPMWFVKYIKSFINGAK